MKHLCYYALFGLLASAAASLAATFSYEVTDLGTGHSINGYQSKVINDRGEVMGNTGDSSGHAALYTGGAWIDLGTLNVSGSDSAGSYANGLNNLGMVVGESNTGSADQWDAFLCPGGGVLSGLGLADSSHADIDAIAYAISNRGVVIGSLVDNTQQSSSPFVFQIGVGLIQSENAGDYNFAINNYGDLLGEAFGDATTAALNGVPLPATITGFVPHAINNSGQILLSADADAALKGAWGMIYDYVTGRIIKLGNLSPKSAGYTAFLDMNDYGQVVGRGVDDGFKPHAVFYSKTTGLVSLDGLNFTIGGTALHLIDAQGINNAGEIVCTGYLETDDPSLTRAVLLTPQTGAGVESLAAKYDGVASVAGFQTGVISIAVAANNSFTAKLKAPGIGYSFKGALTGADFNGIVTSGTTNLNVQLHGEPGTRSFTGSIADGSVTYSLSALRQASVGAAAGKYTALIRSVGVPPAGLPGGIGYARMTVSKTGATSLAGQFGDAAKFSCAAQVHADGTLTFYAPLSSNKQLGGMTGLLIFNRAADGTDCSGQLDWSIPGGSFKGSVQFQGARYTARKAQALKFTNATVGSAAFTITSSDFPTISHALTVTSHNVVAVSDPASDELVVKIVAGSGAFSGSFRAPGASVSTNFSGVIQQKLNLAGGVFAGPTQAGAVLLTPQ